MLLFGLILLCLGWLAPGHYLPWLNFQNEWVAGMGALLIAFSALARSGEQHIRLPALAALSGALAFVPLVQFWAGQVKFVSDAAIAALYVGGFAVAMVAGAMLVRTRRSEFVGGLFAVFLAAGIVSTGMALAQWLELGPISYVADLGPGGRPFANLLQPNHLATLLALAAIGALWLFETRRIGGATAWLAIAWLGLGLVMTRSRTGWLFVIALAISWVWMRRRVGLRTSPLAMGVALSLFFGTSLLWGQLSAAVSVSVPTSFGERLEAGGGRLQFWRGLVDALSASPWVGYGWTQVGVAAYEASLQHFTGESMLRNSHNLLLDLLLWNGLPLGLLVAGALVWWFARRIARCRDPESWLLLAAVGAVFIHAFVEYPLDYTYFLLPVGLMMGALDGLDDSMPAWRVPTAALAAPLVVMAGMLGWIGVEYMRVDASERQLGFVLAGIGVDKVPDAPAPDVWLLDAPREYHRFKLTSAHVGMTATELDWMHRIVERTPSPPAMLRYALAAGLNDRPGEARDTLVRLCNMHRSERCSEGQDAWLQLQRTYPQLQGIAFPDREHQGRPEKP
ncbi:MAG: Wzy polymerase domain-containing protein [Thiobacillus sp.]